jgi:hypothetical protein
MVDDFQQMVPQLPKQITTKEGGCDEKDIFG